MSQYENFTELQEAEPSLAEELLDTFGEGEWQNDALYVFEDFEEFAEYELYDGWFYNNFSDLEANLRGAPNPLDYIDLAKFGEALFDAADERVYTLIEGKIVETVYGW